MPVAPGTQRNEGRRLRLRRRLPLLLVVFAVAGALAGCGGGRSPERPATTTTAVAVPSVLRSSSREVTFPQLRRSIDRLYRLHPGIRTFVARDVQYTPATRDRVLGVCRTGGVEKTARAREATMIAGCAPLVFFFYRYGRQAAVGDSIDVARDVYWYAVGNVRGPFNAQIALSRLLDSWGIP